MAAERVSLRRRVTLGKRRQTGEDYSEVSKEVEMVDTAQVGIYTTGEGDWGVDVGVPACGEGL